MMKNKHPHIVLKIVSFVVCFALIFCGLQFIFSSMYCKTVDSFYSQKDNSIDWLFLGSSQMKCAINAQRLTEEYGIPSFDFCGDGQPLMISSWWLQEALKRQKPQMVVVEVFKIFDTTINGEVISYSYPAMPLTHEKYDSLKTILNGDKLEAAKYCVPLIAYHSWWSQIDPVSTIKGRLMDRDYSSRGFVYRDTAEKVDIAYLSGSDGDVRPVPEESAAAIRKIIELCGENDIELVFIKVPCATDWTRNDSKTVKAFMEDNGLRFIDLNDHLAEIGIDPETDFYDGHHMNTSGANKTTDFVIDFLTDALDGVDPL